MARSRFTVLGSCIAIALAILVCTLPAPSREASAALSVTARPGEWRYLNSDPQATRYSPLDQIDKNTVSNFDKATGVHTTYIEDVNDNQEFFAKMQPLLSKGQSGGRSIIVVTDWMAQKMHELGYVQDLDKAGIPNVEANLRDDLDVGVPATSARRPAQPRLSVSCLFSPPLPERNAPVAA